jgi:hypothetical protein
MTGAETDMSDINKLKEFVRQTMDEMREELSVRERLKGLSAEELIRALPPETLEALARELNAIGSPSKPQ